MELNKSNIKKILFLVAASVTIACLIFNFSAVLAVAYAVLKIFSPFIAGCCIAFAISIPMNFFETRIFDRVEFFKKGKIGFIVKRLTSIIISLTFIIVVISGVVFIVMPELSATFDAVSVKLPVLLDKSKVYFTNLLEKFPSIANEISSFVTNWESIRQSILSFVTTGFWGVSGLIGTVFNGVVTTIIAFIFSFYVLIQKETLSRQFKKLFFAVFSEKTACSIISVLKRIGKTFSGFISGQCIEAIIEGLVFFVVLSVLGFQSSGVIAVIVGFTALIPIVGTFIGAVLSAFLILVFDPIGAIVFLVVFVLLQQITNNLVYPRVVGSSIGLPGIWVMLAVTVGGSLFGVFGMLCMVPTFSVIYSYLSEFVNKRMKTKKISDNLIK